MSKVLNFIFGIILIVFGLNYFFSVPIINIIPYWSIIFPLLLIAIGYLIIKSSTVKIPLEKRTQSKFPDLRWPNFEVRRKKGLILMGILIMILGIINFISVFELIIPFTEYLISGFIPGVLLIIFGAILILMLFGFAGRPIRMSRYR